MTWLRHRHGEAVLRALTDDATGYRVGGDRRAACVALGIRRRFTEPGCPWTSGRAERLNRTLLAVPGRCMSASDGAAHRPAGTCSAVMSTSRVSLRARVQTTEIRPVTASITPMAMLP